VVKSVRCLDGGENIKALGSFRNATNEWHAVVIGFSDGYCPINAWIDVGLQRHTITNLREPWCYAFGRVLGTIALGATAYGLYRLIA